MNPMWWLVSGGSDLHSSWLWLTAWNPEVTVHGVEKNE